jgi:meiotically up-regulated gene 157 (Mug157) protein
MENNNAGQRDAIRSATDDRHMILTAVPSKHRMPPSQRPPPDQRKFRSRAVDDTIERLKPRFKDPRLAVLFENCWPNTLDTTVVKATWEDSFIITGDICAMWLRDSANQVQSYIPFAASDPHLGKMLRGLVMRHLKSVALDPYANAFNINANGKGHEYASRTPPMSKQVYSGKYELDSIASVLQLHVAYWRATKDPSVLGAAYRDAMDTIVNTVNAQRMSFKDEPPQYEIKSGSYHSRPPRHSPFDYPKPAAGTHDPCTNMVRSAFRPSDDPTLYDFLVPANLMLAAALEASVEALEAADCASHATWAATTAHEIRAGAKAHGTVKGTSGISRYVYEVDGCGGVNEMDDANVPSLLSLPYLGVMSKEDKTYQATREWVLSSQNPHFFCGSVAQGIGSPHTGHGGIWQMSIIMQAMTSTSDAEIVQCLDWLISSACLSGFMHETFDMDNVASITRPWFAWANSLFGELILLLVEERPHLILETQGRPRY